MSGTLIRKIAVGSVASVFVILTAAPAFAATQAGGFPWGSWAVSMVNLAIFVGALVYFAGPRIQSYLRERRENLAHNLEEAKRLRQEAEAQLEEYSTRLGALEAERQQLMDEYHEQGRREQERMVAEAKKQVEKMRADAELIIQQEVRQAVATIEQQAVDLAVQVAVERVRERMNEPTQNVLVDQYVDDLKTLD